MKRYLLAVTLLVALSPAARSQEVLMSLYEQFIIEPGRVLKIESQGKTNWRRLELELVRATDIQLDSSRRAIFINTSDQTGEDWKMYLDLTDAYGVLNFLEHCKRAVIGGEASPATPLYSYTTTTGVNFSVKEMSGGRQYLTVRHWYAYSNAQVPFRMASYLLKDVGEFMLPWKSLLDASREP